MDVLIRLLKIFFFGFAAAVYICPDYADGLYAGGANVCSYTVRRSQPYQATIAYTAYQSYRTCCSYFMWCWSKCTKSRAVTRYRLETRYRSYYVSHYTCCRGWIQGAGSSECRVAVCNSPGCIHGRCTRPNTCDCSNTGYTSPSTGCNVDDNECATANGGCQQHCNNYPGGFSCSCRRGFTSYNSRYCRDNNECAVSHGICKCDDAANNPSCNAACYNTIGSFRCSCSSGYRIVASTRCVDINECMASNGGCEHYCSNLPGSHRCSCRVGYALDASGKRCHDVDECLVNKGGCEDTCVNKIGSYECRCSHGHILDSNGRTCSDIDECATVLHFCQQRCNNYKGGYYCSCNNGYKLSSDNKTCSDIDECSIVTAGPSGTNVTLAGCTQLCHNNIGSFSCACRSGFKLLRDGKTCLDIDECSGSHGCDQICVNTIGTYLCKCRQGYRLNVNGRSCDALPCIRLPPLINGNGTCFSGRTNDTCQLGCHVGFNLRGSSQRRCLPNHKWSGSLGTCRRKTCDEVNPPNNGAVVLPCMRYYQASCTMKCTNGYYPTGPTERMCKVTGKNTMYWNNANTICKKITVCSPNPCKHNGICKSVSKSEYKCNCQNTGYKGKICNRGIIRLPEYPVMKINQLYNFTIAAKPYNQLTLEISSSNGGFNFLPSSVNFLPSRASALISMQANQPGMHVIYYNISGTDVDEFDKPSKSIVYVKNEKLGNLSLTDNVINDEGAFVQGCHDSNKLHVKEEKKERKEGVLLHSSEKWQQSREYEWTDGVIVMAVEGSILPISVVGSNVSAENIVNKGFDSFIQRYSIVNIDSPRNKVATKEATKQKCVSKQPSTKYLTDVVELNSFPKTLVDAMNKQTPYWINLFAELSTKTFNIGDFIANVYNETKVKQLLPECAVFMSNNFNGHELYAYATDQRMMLHVAEEELELDSGKKVCIFQSVDRNDIFIGFPNSGKKSISLMKSNGWSGEMKSIEFRNSSENSSYQVSGKYSTRIMNNKSAIDIDLQGDMKFSMPSDGKFPMKGITGLLKTTINGLISFRIRSSSLNSTDDFSCTGKGIIAVENTGREYNKNCPSNNFVMTIESASRIFVGPGLKNNVKVSSNSKVKVKLSVNDTGGEILNEQNITEVLAIDRELKNLNSTISYDLTQALNSYPKYPFNVSSILLDMNKALLLSGEILTLCRQHSGSRVLQPLVKLKKTVNLIERKFQVLSIILQSSMSTESFAQLLKTFHTSMNTTKSVLKMRLKRATISRKANSYSLFTSGTMCLGNLCFIKSSMQIMHGLTNLELEKCYNVSSMQDNTAVLIGMTGKERTLAGVLKIPQDSKVVLILDGGGQGKAHFNAFFTMYGTRESVQVTVSNSTLSFSAAMKLSDNSISTVDLYADVSALKTDDDVMIRIKGSLNKDSNLINKLNIYLQNQLQKMSNETNSRVSTLQKSLVLSGKQQKESTLHLDNARQDYKAKAAIEEEINKQIKATILEYARLKSVLQSRLQKYNSAAANYTHAIEKCAPRICVSKCTPGVVKEICYNDRYITVLMKSCSLVTKNYVKTDYKQITSVASVITYDGKSTCQTKCPPLTGFFKSVFGRKRRGLVMTLVSKFAKPLGTKLFGYLGGETGEMGAKIGAYLPGPWGIVGMIVGGIIGSAFGSCDRTCNMEYTPRELKFKKYDVEKIARTVFYKESECKDIVKEKKSGFQHAFECLKQRNCSEQLTDTRCVHENQKCYTLRKILKQKIDEERDLGADYSNFETQSLKLESLETAKRFAKADKENAFQTLSSAKSLALTANYSLYLAKQSLASTSTLLSLEIKASQAVERFGAEAFLVESGRWLLYASKDSKIPTSVALDMVVNRESSKKITSTSIIDFSNVNESIASSTSEIIKNLFGKPQRARRSLSTEGNTDTITISELNLNVTKRKCLTMENNIFYLVKVADGFLKGLLQIENATKEIEKSEELRAKFLQSVSDKINQSDICSANRSLTEGNCSASWLLEKYNNLTKERSDEKNISLSWPAKRTQIISHLEVYTKNQNYTTCAGVRDCLGTSIATISELVKFDQSQLAALSRKAIPFWVSSFKYILEEESASQNLTKKHARIILNSIKSSRPTLIYCDSPPVIAKDLPSAVIIKKKSSVYLEFLLEKSDHAATYVWRKDGNEISSFTKNALFLTNIDKSLQGFYNCEISNKFGKVSTKTAHVIYEEKPVITQHPKGMKKTIKSPSSLITLMCNSTGAPNPEITWLYAPFSNFSDRNIFPSNQTTLQFNITSTNQSGFYFCKASNIQGYVLSRPARVHVLASTIAEFSVKVSFTVHIPMQLNDTQNISLASTHSMPLHLTQKDRVNLTTILANHMNISTSRIGNVYYSKSSNLSGLLSFDIKTKELNNLLVSSAVSDWSSISEDIVMSRKGLLILPMWLHYVFTNITKNILVGGVNAMVDANTIDADPQAARCPDAHSLNSNGFICEICSAGTKFVAGDGCNACPIGSYQPLQGQSECLQCGRNQSTRSFGSVHPGDCYVPAFSTTSKTSLRSTSKSGTSTITKIGTSRITEIGTKKPLTAIGSITTTKHSTSDETLTTGHLKTTSNMFETPVKKSHKEEPKRLSIIIGSSFAAAVIVFVVLGILYNKCSRKARARKREGGKGDYLTDDSEPSPGQRNHPLSFSNEVYPAFRENAKFERAGGIMASSMDFSNESGKAPTRSMNGFEMDTFPTFKNIRCIQNLAVDEPPIANGVQVIPYHPYKLDSQA